MGGKTHSKKIKKNNKSRLKKTPTKKNSIKRIEINNCFWDWFIFQLAKIHNGIINKVNNTKKIEIPSIPKIKFIFKVVDQLYENKNCHCVVLWLKFNQIKIPIKYATIEPVKPIKVAFLVFLVKKTKQIVKNITKNRSGIIADWLLINMKLFSIMNKIY